MKLANSFQFQPTTSHNINTHYNFISQTTQGRVKSLPRTMMTIIMYICSKIELVNWF